MFTPRWYDVALFAGALLVLTTAASCESQRPTRVAAGPAAAASPAGAAVAPATEPGPRALGGHWVQDWRVRAIMQRIAPGSNAPWPKDLPEDPEAAPTAPATEGALADAAALADSLAAAADEVPKAVADRPMSAADRRGFAARAAQLRQQALELKAQAQAGKIEQMHRTLNAINSTCFDCHSRHRDLTDHLAPGRAGADWPNDGGRHRRGTWLAVRASSGWER